jgi:hypothetical protein
VEPTRDERFNRYLEEFLVEHDEVLRRLAKGIGEKVVEQDAELLQRLADGPSQESTGTGWCAPSP